MDDTEGEQCFMNINCLSSFAAFWQFLNENKINVKGNEKFHLFRPLFIDSYHNNFKIIPESVNLTVNNHQDTKEKAKTTINAHRIVRNFIL